jgi:serine/threonine protein phosphatase PrpC
MPEDTAQRLRPAAELRIRLGQFSSAGRKAENQDFHGAMLPEGTTLRIKGIALALADGISSSPHARAAAETAVAGFLSDYYATPEGWSVKTAAAEVIRAGNSWAHARNRAAHLESMDHGHVCTLEAMVLKGRQAHLFHIGDGGIWRLAGDSLEPLTVPHRLVLSSAESYLARAIGLAERVEIDYRALDLAVGDVLLLLTDGVQEHLEPRAMAQILRQEPEPQAAAEALCAAALAAGSPDNLSAQVVVIDALPDSAAGLVADLAALPLPALPREGDMIDGLRILRSIHANARSHIFLAEAPDGALRALKIPSVALREDPDFRRRFLMEEWVARRLSSPHVLRAADPPQPRRALYVLTEFIEGQTLRQWMTDHPRAAPSEIRDMLEQISRGLRAFHRREMLHQDLRPENILITHTGTVKIIDFGAAYVAGVEEAGPAPAAGIPGTLQYTAPEYFTGETVSWRSDQFSLGVIAYEMLTGALPYGTAVSRLRRPAERRRLRYHPARAVVPGLPDWIDTALARALHPEPAQRYAALSEFIAALRDPGPAYHAGHHLPLIERDPLRFWKGLSTLLALLVLVLLAKISL